MIAGLAWAACIMLAVFSLLAAGHAWESWSWGEQAESHLSVTLAVALAVLAICCGLIGASA